FSAVLARSVPRQQRPYPPLAEVVRHEREFTFTDVTGSLVGFRFPDYAQGINVPGYHLHFLSDDRTRGGHVLDCTVVEGELLVDHSSHLHMELPAALDPPHLRASAEELKAIRNVEGRG